ncbi:MAG: hypothetical protein PHI90_04210 [Clostridia bacterium]|nr:hypothetical protein [Clostridia bacterium]
MIYISGRIVEAYVGEYASGKSEVALNRALNLLKGKNKQVTLVDFDLVEPFYTLRPIKKELEQKGLTVLAWDTANTMGLGETGNILKPEIRWALKREGDIIIDVGYGVVGIKKLNLLEGAEVENKVKVYVVINIARPMTSDLEGIVEYVTGLGRVDGLINNSHLGADTDIEIIQEGSKIVTRAAQTLGIPVRWTTIDIKFIDRIKDRDIMGNPIFFLKRHMNRSFW